MGIQGLLPILKPIQRHKHLSDFAGQTLAVDAYVWLHRGAYACAAELVQNRPTRKYVDYCMHRVRLLRHHGIAPYLDREKRRAENVKRALELSAQGKESQARDYYVKCVDVTPQMAYQVIKALKAEDVSYIVAPYEADAQLAYLERIGLVDGIITEDSDLLVFGCRNVLFKLDAVSATIINITRSDFGSPSLISDSVSLVGWSDAQFRWMAMLSGCDYLPSISGIGLKTAYQLLKKYKTVDKVVKMVQLEGKKTVPQGYLDAFYLAEKVFLHQRVYDPRLEKLVYLTNPSSDFGLSEQVELYIGRDLDISLAKRIAEGDACPISMTDMEDINPSFTPKIVRPLPLQSRDTNTAKTPNKKEPTSKKGGILGFFTPVTKTHSTAASLKTSSTLNFVSEKQTSSRAIAGNASGKRTLVDVMEQDVAIKKKKFEEEVERKRKTVSSSSRFFNKNDNVTPEAGPSRKVISNDLGKENARPKERGPIEKEENIFDPVEQEDGYLSPSPYLSRNSTPDLSSPTVARRINSKNSFTESVSAYDLLSSPALVRTVHAHHRGETLTQDISTQYIPERILVRGSSEPPQECNNDGALGPDLALNFGREDDEDDLDTDARSDQSSEILCWDDADAKASFTPSPNTSVSPPMATQTGSQAFSTAVDDNLPEAEDLLDEEELNSRIREAAYSKVAQGWATRFSFGSPLIGAKTKMKAQSSLPMSVKVVSVSPQPSIKGQRSLSSLKGQKSDPHLTSRSFIASGTGSRDAPMTLDSDDIVEEETCNAKRRLEAFRFSR